MITAPSCQYPGLTFWDLLAQIPPLPGNLDSCVRGLPSACQSNELVVPKHIMESFCQLPVIRTVERLPYHRSANFPLALGTPIEASILGGAWCDRQNSRAAQDLRENWEREACITMFTTAHSDAVLVAAATILGWLWLKFVTEYMERKSIYSFPSTSHALDPWALTGAIYAATRCQICPGVAS